VARTRAELDSLRANGYNEDAMLLADVLARDGIDPAVNEDFLRTLRRFHFLHLSLHGDYVLFARTRESGLVYAGPGAPPLVRGGSVPGTGVEIFGARMGRWSRYGCCAPRPTIGPDTPVDSSAGDTAR